MIKYLLHRIRLLSNARKEPYLRYYQILGFYPRNIKLYQQAFTHKSTQQKNIQGKFVNNERLEFLGDAILGALISDVLYHKFHGKSEGFLTNTRSKIVQRESLNQIALEIGLDKLISFALNTNIQKNNIFGNAFEALIGAIYLDYGYDQCKVFIEKKVLNQLIDLDTVANKEVNFKSRLIEWSQKNKVIIHFEVIEEYLCNDNKPVFQTQILVNGHVAGTGAGLSKKESQQNAAKLSLLLIKEKPLFWENTPAIITTTSSDVENTTIPQEDENAMSNL